MTTSRDFDRLPHATLQQINTADGPMWRGCIDGECWQHHQAWQVRIWLQARLGGLDYQCPASRGPIDHPTP